MVIHEDNKPKREPAVSSKDLKKLFSFNFEYINFGRFDAGGVMHHSNYYHLLEELRERYLISKSLSYKKLMDDGFHLPIVHSEQFFLKPVLYDQKLIGNLYVNQLKNSSISLYHEILNDKLDILHITITKHVLVKNIKGEFKVTKITKSLADIF